MERTHPTAPPPTMRTGTSVMVGMFALRGNYLTGRGVEISLKVSSRARHNLKQELQRQLQLARIEHRPRRSEERIGRRGAARRAASHLASLNRQACRILILTRDYSTAEVVRSVDANDLIDVCAIQEVESIEGSFETHSFAGQ